MMKKIALVSILCWTSLVQAQEKEVDDFQFVYKNMQEAMEFQDREEEVLLLLEERVHTEFKDVNGAPFQLPAEEEYQWLNPFELIPVHEPVYQNKDGYEILKFYWKDTAHPPTYKALLADRIPRQQLARDKNKLSKDFQREKKIWDWEKDLMRRLKHDVIYSDENHYNGSNDPDAELDFDHIEDWNVFDELMFGDKYKPTEPSFAEIGTGLSLAEQPWQVGHPGKRKGDDGFTLESKVTNPEELYGCGDKSIAAIADKILATLTGKGHCMGYDGLNNVPLQAERNTQQQFEPAGFSEHWADIFKNWKFSYNEGVNAPAAEPEFNTWADLKDVDTLFKTMEDEILYERSCEKLLEVGRSESTEYDLALQECRGIKRLKWERLLDAITLKSDLQLEALSDNRHEVMLEYLDDHLEIWLLHVEIIREKLELIASKPIAL